MQKEFVVRVITLVLLLMGGASALAPRPARAQSITVTTSATTVKRKLGNRPNALNQYSLWINQAECKGGDVFEFLVSATGDFRGHELQLWAGTGANCLDLAERTRGAAAQCWQVGAARPTEASTTVPVYARNLVARNVIGGLDVTTEAPASVCDEQKSEYQAFDLYLFFVSGTQTLGDGAKIAGQMGFDVTPPAAPANVHGISGDGQVHLLWDDSTANDVSGYNLYCDSPPAGRDTVVSADDGLFVSDAGAAISSSDAATERHGEGAEDGGVGSGGGVDASTASQPNCAPSALHKGGTPDRRYFCGYADGKGADSGTASKLVNGRRYVVAAAAVDQIGNVGPLSNTACATPVEITDFFELYRGKGGQGGGLCSISRRHFESRPWLLGLCALGVCVAWRRRARSAVHRGQARKRFTSMLP